MENRGGRLREINLGFWLDKMLKCKRLFVISLSAAFVLSSFLILSVPRYYVCEVKLAPETTTPDVGGLGALASSLGFNMSSMLNQDAIVPELYPDLMESVDFQTSMFPVKVKTLDGKIQTTYYEYLHRYQKFAWWDSILNWIKKLFKGDADKYGSGMDDVNPFRMSKTQTDIVKIIKDKITCSVDKKTSVISISVEDQDPLVCATLADTAKVRLQEFIINYRTNKARVDLDYTKQLYAEAKHGYDNARKAYAAYSDSHQDLVLESFKAKQEELENEMQLQYNNYQQISQQLQLARAKLQERTPAFTTLQSATVPIKPAGPKRMIFVAVMVFVTFAVTALYVYKKDI